MITGSKNTGFCYMITFFINIFRGSTFGAIPDESDVFKFITVGFDNIAAIQLENIFSKHSR